MTKHPLLIALGLALAGCAQMASNTSSAPAASAPAKVETSAAANPDVPEGTPMWKQGMQNMGEKVALAPHAGKLVQTPEALAAHQKSEIEKWWPVIKSAGIKAD